MYDDTDKSVSSEMTGGSSATLMKLNSYIYSNIQDHDDGDAPFISSITDEGSNSYPDQNTVPEHTELERIDMPVITHSFSDDGSVDLVLGASRNAHSDSGSKKRDLRRAPLLPKQSTHHSLVSNSSSTTGVISRTSHSSKTKMKKIGSSGKGVDVSLDLVIERLSKKSDYEDIALPPKAAWESKVKYLAGLIDDEKENTTKLGDIEKMLERKKIQAKADTEQAKWKSRVRELEGLLEKKRKQKEVKLRRLAGILGELKKEKNEMKKYEKPGQMWNSTSHKTDFLASTPNRPARPDRAASSVRTMDVHASKNVPNRHKGKTVSVVEHNILKKQRDSKYLH